MIPSLTIGQPATQLTEEFNAIPPPNPDAPRSVFPSDLRLTREQEDALTTHALDRYRKLVAELGRTETNTAEDGVPSFISSPQDTHNGRRSRESRSFMAKRHLYALMAENDYSWRPLLRPNSIYAKSNLAVPLCRRIWKQMSARGINYFFGTDPWLACDAIGLEDEVLSKSIQQLAQTKYSEHDNQDNLRRSIAIAFAMGECVLKTTHAKKVSYFSKLLPVAIGESGEILSDNDGEPIQQSDEWVALPEGNWALKRSLEQPQPVVHPNPESLTFELRPIEQRITHYEGPEQRPIYFRDFLCPLTAPSIQDADCVVHIMGYSANQLASDYMANPGTDLEQLSTAIEAITNALSNDSTARSGSDNRAEQGEVSPPSTSSPTMEIGEFYIRFDANGDGYEEDIMLVMDLNSGYPIHYNYTANVTDTGTRPFNPIVPSPVLNRWYGQGTFEQFEKHQEIIDLLINRRNVSQGEAGRVTFWNPQFTTEGQLNTNLKLNWGTTYTPLPNKKAEDILSVVYLDDNKFDRLTEEMESFLQFALNESGVQHANDAALTGADSTKLATGIRNIERSGQEMFGVYISELEKGIACAANDFVTTLYANITDQETFLIYNGNVPQELTIAARDVKHLRFNVRVLLSRYKGEQILASSSQAEALITRYYSLHPILQQILSQFYVDMLGALQVKNPERLIIPKALPLPPIGAGGIPQAPQDTPNTPPPNL